MLKIVKLYSTFILKRDYNYGSSHIEVTNFDKDTISLLLFNQFTLHDTELLAESKKESLINSISLSLLYDQDSSLEDLLTKIEERIYYINRSSRVSLNTDLLCLSLKKLLDDGLVEKYTNHDKNYYKITDVGKERISLIQGPAILLRKQFENSIKTRIFYELKEENNHIQNAIMSFINDSIEERALAVYYTLERFTTEQHHYYITSLFQSLPKYIESLKNEDEASVLIKVLEDILSSPQDIESEYIGLNLQSRFTIHLIGLDQSAFQTRIGEIKNTIYIIDSSTLIPLIAQSSQAHNASKELINSLKKINCKIITTSRLIFEVVEHLCWAISKLSPEGLPEISTLEATLGKAGMKKNAFLEGFIDDHNSGICNDFNDYLGRILHCKINGFHEFENKIIESLYANFQIVVQDIDSIDGFDTIDYDLIEVYKNKISELRKRYNTFKHERQVMAEAEVALIIKQLRTKKYNIDGLYNSMFVSSSRIIDGIECLPNPITTRPETILQFVASMTSWDNNKLVYLSNYLLWEMSINGFNFINVKKLNIFFSPYIKASKDDYLKNIDHYRSITYSVLGEKPEDAFKDVNDLEFSISLEKIKLKQINDLEDKLKYEKEKRIQAEKDSKIVKAQKNLLEKLKIKEDKKKAKRLKNQRRRDSKKKK